jgi:WD40 repeat protein/serine/threonine protein kinase
LRPFRRFGDYELIEEIARGGMGVVFKARQISLDRVVALKLLLSGQFASPDALARFRAEALISAGIRHPNIVPVYDVGDANGQPFLAMEYVAGQNLADVVRDHPLPARRAAELVRTIAEAVHYAHEQGILHRDLKPSNVLLDQFDQPRVTDFGLAKRLGLRQRSAALDSGEAPENDPPLAPATPGESARGLAHSKTSRTPDSQLSTQDPLNSLTLSGQVLGSPSFIAPEQAAGTRGAIGPASDVYSLGALLYHLLTGRAPFQSTTITETLREVIEREPASPRLLNSGIPCDLETLCLKCLEKEPRKRYASAQDFADELGRFLRDEPIHVRPTGPAEKLWRWCRRKPALAGLALALLLVGAAGLAGILWQWRRAEANASAANRHASSEAAQRVRAEEAVTMLELQRAEDLLEKDETVHGVAHLARIVRQQPDNHVAATRLVSALTQRDFVLPVGPPLQHGRRVTYAEFSSDGRRVVTTSIDRRAQVWDARTGQPAGEPMVHSNEVRYAHFSPDGQRVVTVSDSVEALLWEIATSRPIGQPMRHEKRVRDAQFSPDGRQIVTASEDQTARLWDAHTGEPSLRPPLEHVDRVRRAGFSPNGRWIVTTSGNTAFLWDAESGQPVGKPLFQGVNENIDGVKLNSARFSPDSQWIVTASDFGTARVWEVATGKPVTPWLRHKGEVVGAEFHPDGRRVVTAANDGGPRIWDAQTGQPLTEPLLHGGLMISARFSPDGQRLLTVGADNTVRLSKARAERLLAVPFQHDGTVHSASFSPDGQFVVTAAAGAARIWDIRPGRAFELILPLGTQVNSVHFSPDGEWLSTSGRAGQVWDARTGRPRTPPMRHPGGTYPAPFSPDGQRVLTGSWGGTARLWDARTGQPVCEPLRHDGKVNYAEFSPDGKWFLTLSGNKAIRLWDAHTGQFHSELVRQNSLSGYARFSPDSQTVAFGVGDNDTVRIMDINTGNTRVELRGHRATVINMHFSSDGRRIVTASEDGTARVWDAATGAPVTPPLVHKSSVPYAEFSPDGSLVVTASHDATARVWDAQTGRALTEPLRHRGPMWEATFSPDGQQVLTSSLDSTVRLWDSHTGRPLADPFRHADIVWRSAFSPDGQRAATASRDGTARIWELPTTLPAFGPDESPPGFGLRQSSGALERAPDQKRQKTAALHDAAATSSALLLADLAEAVIGQRLGEDGTLEPVSSARLVELRRQLSGQPATNAFTRWLAWFLADRSTRTISPNSLMTIPEYIARRMEEKTLAAASEAVLLAPTNARALAHLAEMLLASPGSNAPVAVAEAGFLIRRAEILAPGDARVQQSRQRIERQFERRPVR